MKMITASKHIYEMKSFDNEADAWVWRKEKEKEYRDLGFSIYEESEEELFPLDPVAEIADNYWEAIIEAEWTQSEEVPSGDSEEIESVES